MKLSCKIKNTGARAGDEVVQLYIRDEYASLPRPVKEGTLRPQNGAALQAAGYSLRE